MELCFHPVAMRARRLRPHRFARKEIDGATVAGRIKVVPGQLSPRILCMIAVPVTGSGWFPRRLNPDLRKRPIREMKKGRIGCMNNWKLPFCLMVAAVMGLAACNNMSKTSDNNVPAPMGAKGRSDTSASNMGSKSKTTSSGRANEQSNGQSGPRSN